MSSFLKLSALVVVSTLFAFAVGEWALRAAGWTTLRINPDQLHFWRHDPQLGWAHRPGQEGIFETDQVRTHVRINEKGLRDAERQYERSGDTKRILVIGDSFAWGFGVEEADRFSELLSDSLGAEVINASVSGYSTDQNLLWLRHEGIRYDFDLLVGVFPGNDHYDNHLSRNYFVYHKPRFELVADTLALRDVPVPRPPPHLILERFLMRHSAIVHALSRQVRGLYDRMLLRSDAARFVHTNVLRNPDPPGVVMQGLDSEDPFALTRALIREVRHTANAKGAEFMMVSTSRYWIGDHVAGGSYQDLMEAVRSDGILLLDVESLPGFDRGAMVIPNDGHWNEAGNAFVARQIHQFIEEHRLLEGVSAPDAAPALP